MGCVVWKRLHARWSWNSCLVGIILTATLGGIAHSDEAPTARELIDGFEQSINKLQCVHLEISETGYRSLTPGAKEELAGGNDFVIFRDRDNWRCTVRQRANRERDDGTRFEARGTSEYIVRDTFLRVEHLDRPARRPSENIRLSGRLEAPKVEGRFLREMLSLCSVAFGVLPSPHNLSLVEVLRNSESLALRPEPEVLNGVTTQVVRATGPHGVHTIWIDLNAGCLPRKIEMRMTVKPDEWRQRRKDLARRSARPQVTTDGPSPNENIFRFEDIQIQNLDGTFVIVGFDLSRVMVYEDREELYGRSVLRGRVLEISRDGWPDHPFAPTVEIPNGTPVRVEDDLSGSYEWTDGQIQKSSKSSEKE